MNCKLCGFEVQNLFTCYQENDGSIPLECLERHNRRLRDYDGL
jgi:hypothetical protein